MSDKKKPLWVSPQAHAHVAEFAEQDGIGMFEAANRLVLSATPVPRRAVSSAPTQADFDAMKADRDRLQVEIEEADEARRAAEQRLSFAAEGDPRVTAYAKETSTTYADALDKLVRLGISRAKALDKHAAGKRAG